MAVSPETAPRVLALPSVVQRRRGPFLWATPPAGGSGGGAAREFGSRRGLASNSLVSLSQESLGFTFQGSSAAFSSKSKQQFLLFGVWGADWPDFGVVNLWEKE